MKILAKHHKYKTGPLLCIYKSKYVAFSEENWHFFDEGGIIIFGDFKEL